MSETIQGENCGRKSYSDCLQCPEREACLRECERVAKERIMQEDNKTKGGK